MIPQREPLAVDLFHTLTYERLPAIARSGVLLRVDILDRLGLLSRYMVDRHSFVSFCIDHNIPKAVAVSILGADSDIIDQYYTHIGEDAQERAIQLISGTATSLKQRHEQALQYLASVPENEKTGRLRQVEQILRG